MKARLAVNKSRIDVSVAVLLMSGEVTQLIWAGWHIPAMRADAKALAEGDLEAAGTAGLEAESGQTLFEAILASGLPDDQSHVV